MGGRRHGQKQNQAELLSPSALASRFESLQIGGAQQIAIFTHDDGLPSSLVSAARMPPRFSSGLPPHRPPAR